MASAANLEGAFIRDRSLGIHGLLTASDTVGHFELLRSPLDLVDRWIGLRHAESFGVSNGYEIVR